MYPDVFHCVQAQKELLDAELDLYKKTQAGEDTAMLKIKYTQLQIEVLILSVESTIGPLNCNSVWSIKLNGDQIYALLFQLFPSLHLLFRRQLKEGSCHLDEAVEPLLGVTVLLGPGEGALEGEEEVCQCTQSWTIGHERSRFLVLLRRSELTCCHTLL